MIFEPTPENVKKGKRNVQGVPQSQTAAHPRHQEEEETVNTIWDARSEKVHSDMHKCVDSDHLTHMQSIIRGLCSPFIHYIESTILLADSEADAQADLGIAVRICSKTRFHI